ncbi:MAG TPA: 3-methyl-2-oxobutanoate hydroxymethyltransferase [Terrimicrobiaceae bacterium]|nr:3-methyl-2-oxobutanoate hydroxymethyltransferase [Terrimicrobiaceae bacterium]
MSPRNSFLERKQNGWKFTSLTAYDYPMGRLLDAAGLDFLLVGDSLGMVVLGHPDTTQVTLEDMLHHTRAVARGVQQTLLIADLPAHSFDTSEQALASARRLIEAGAGGVKLEGGEEARPMIETLVAAGIPVLGHIGMLPQRVREEGGYRIKGKTPQQADQLLKDAAALDAAGVFAMVLELVSPPLASQISQAVAAPTIGIGSGTECDGQILVTHDLLGMFPWFTPRFVQPKVHLAPQIQQAVGEFINEIRGTSSQS